MNDNASEHVELEAKLAVTDLASPRSLLTSLSAECVGRWRETDRFFDFADRRLARADSALRLRRRVDVATSEGRWSITFKGPRRPGRFKQRLEIEFTVDDGDAVRAMFQAVGLAEFVSYSKERTSFRRRGCTIELDRLDELGTFVEVEGPSEDAIEAVLAELKLDRLQTITTSYLEMVLAHREKHT